MKKENRIYFIIAFAILMYVIFSMGCNKEPLNSNCGICRVYVYKFDMQGNILFSDINDLNFCNENYKNLNVLDTIDNIIYKTQKECY